MTGDSPRALLDAEVARRWPHLPQTTSKQRARGRRRLAEVVKMEAMQAAGKVCKSCVFITAAPASLPKYRFVCDLHSGGGAYQPIGDPERELCLSHVARSET